MPTALVVETGSQSSTANSYITVSEYSTYITDRHGARNSPSNDQITSFIHQAMSFFETLEFHGVKATEDQALQYPRSGLRIDGYGINSDEIPSQVKTALYEITYAYEQGYGIDDPVLKQSSKEKIGNIEVEYKTSSADRTLTPAVSHALRKLIKNPLRVVRA